ncbi:MAG: hypothetical protein VX890_01830 [Pseudomonadota bacterium]|nr:hypothetical protein [Pseudomonadota bacterium]
MTTLTYKDEELTHSLIKIIRNSGQAIIKVYNSDFDYEFKKDLSPLTKADTISHQVIKADIQNVF